MEYTVTEASFASLNSYWADSKHKLNWDTLFVLPSWLEVWWQVFGSDFQLCLRAIRQGEKIIGVAPLLVKEKTASIIGSADVCDYLDFIVIPGMERDFFHALLNDLRQKGISQLDLKPVRPDSTVFTNLVALARQWKYEVLCYEEGISVELDLPSTWDEYLAMLTKKQRHEVKRKLRRLWEADNVEYHCVKVSQEVGSHTDTFFKLFSLSQEDKANFMTAQMRSFFRLLAEAMAKIGLLRVGTLEVDELPVAMIMGFDYNNTMYLYNSAYDPNYSHLTVGLLSKVLCIKESIRRGNKKWDFLKGGEPYKYHIGGKEIPLYACQIKIK
jgi:CelD/BcsL family acetyltransferase involved in cellulose biosynthesis